MFTTRYLSYLRYIRQSLDNNTLEVCKAQDLGISPHTLMSDAVTLRRYGIPVIVVGHDRLLRCWTRKRRLSSGQWVITEDAMYYYGKNGRRYSKLRAVLTDEAGRATVGRPLGG